jgi:hypothetical protein
MPFLLVDAPRNTSFQSFRGDKEGSEAMKTRSYQRSRVTRNNRKGTFKTSPVLCFCSCIWGSRSVSQPKTYCTHCCSGPQKIGRVYKACYCCGLLTAENRKGTKPYCTWYPAQYPLFFVCSCILGSRSVSRPKT